jgi:hypothetical protein
MENVGKATAKTLHTTGHIWSVPSKPTVNSLEMKDIRISFRLVERCR